MQFSQSITNLGVRLATIVVILAVSGVPVLAQNAEPSTLEIISSQRYIVIDDETGEVFAEKDADVRGGMASLTKIFTAIIALERAPINFPITAEESDEFDSTSTRMTGFFAGNTYTVEDLLHGMLLESGNDAAQALARGIGAVEGDTPEESVNRFVGRMNDKVAELGLTDTHFVNPHGLSNPEHYSTPRNLAAFMMYATQNSKFMNVITARTYVDSVGNTITSTNRGPEFISSYIGGKTGFDEETGYCLIEIGQAGDVQLISVTIDGVAPVVWYEDHAILLQYGFAARADRIAAGDPIGGDVVAFAQPGTDDEQLDEGEPAVEPTALMLAAFDINAPRPVRIDGEPVPQARETETDDGISGNWFLGLVILALIIGLLLLRSGVIARTPSKEEAPEPPVA